MRASQSQGGDEFEARCRKFGTCLAIVRQHGAGLDPGSVGLYQFNATVPANLPSGDQAIQISLNGAADTLQTLFVPGIGPDAPGPPTNPVATAGNGSASIAFSAPASNGGAAITGYTAACTAGNATFTAAGAR